VSFMAKPHADRAGSGCHIHISLWRDGANAFAGDRDLGLGTVRGSDELAWFLGGCLTHAGEVMPLFAPNVNSYKRYAHGSFAPTAMVWGEDNRTCAFRVVGHGKGMRLESRLAGGDCNPYLAFAALIAMGIEGIDQGMALEPAYTGNAYESDAARVPGSLHEAVRLLEGSEFARRAFGDVVIDHYLNAARQEQQAFESAVTDWELHRSFERT